MIWLGVDRDLPLIVAKKSAMDPGKNRRIVEKTPANEEFALRKENE